MAFSFLRLPFSVDRDDLPVIPNSDYESFLGVGPELSAWGHWSFGGDSGSLSDSLYGRALSPVNSTVEYNAESLVIPGNDNTGLASTFADAEAQTLCAVFKRKSFTPSTSQGTILMGAFGPQTPNEGGSCVFIHPTTEAIVLNTRTEPSTTSYTSPDGMGDSEVGDWLFVALSEDFSGTNRDRKLFLGGVSAGYEETVINDKVLAIEGRTVGLGCLYFVPATTFNNDLEVAEFILFDRGLSLSEIGSVYQRSVARMAAKGLTLYTE